MKTLLPTAIIGLIVLYFMGAAFHIDYWTMEMFIHNAIRFFAGFVFLGILVCYQHSVRLKVALYLILTVLTFDIIMDYMRDINNIRFEMLIHDGFVVIWGALIGFFFMRQLKKSLP